MSQDKTMPLNLRRFLTGTLTVVLLVLFAAQPAEAAHKRKRARLQQPNRYAAIVVEASTGYVLSAQNADKKLYPASLTKMMTLYLTFDALENGKLSRNERIFVSRRAAAQEPSSLGLEPGERIRVEDAILSIATKSANDSAVVLAEAIAGSEEAFARAMTVKARELGMMNTRFVNASGLFNRQQYSTARDMAALGRALIRDHADYYRYFSTTSFNYNDETYLNHNRLMNSYPGMDGIKTGYVYASGYNLAASAVQNGTRLIGVIFGGRTAKSRNNAMAQLLSRSFARISDIRVAELVADHPLPARRPAPAAVAEIASADTVPSAEASAEAPEKVVDQGDTDVADDSTKATIETPRLEPEIRTASAARDHWTIQIGAFSNREASLHALDAAKARLQGLARGTRAVAAPLMTKRGVIYRARLLGLERGNAARACGILKGTCLVLAAE